MGQKKVPQGLLGGNSSKAINVFMVVAMSKYDILSTPKNTHVYAEEHIHITHW